MPLIVSAVGITIKVRDTGKSAKTKIAGISDSILIGSANHMCLRLVIMSAIRRSESTLQISLMQKLSQM